MTDLYKPVSVKTPEDLTERRKELLYFDGYDVTTGLTVQDSSPNVKETDIPVYGQDENITGTNVTSANVSATIMEPNIGVQGAMRLIHGMKPVKDPAFGTLKQYRAKDIKPVTPLILRKANDDTSIVSSRLYIDATFSPVYPSGAADDKTVRAWTGKSGPAREFDGLVTCDVVTEGDTLRSTPYTVPREADGVYAIYIKVADASLGQDNDDMPTDSIKTPTSGMVNSAGVPDWTEIRNASSLSTVTHAQIYYIVSGATGIPATNSTIEPEGLRGTIT